MYRMQVKDSLFYIHLKIIGGYFSLITIFVLGALFVTSETKKLNDTNRRYAENIGRRHLSEHAFLQLFDLTLLDEQVAAWEEEQMAEYEQKEAVVLCMFDSLRRQMPDTVQVQRVDEIRNLVAEKKDYLLAIHADLEQLRDINGLMKERVPEIIRRANRANERLSDEVSENLQTNRHKTTGLRGIFKNRKKADEQTERDNLRALSRAKQQTNSILALLASDIKQSQERGAEQLFGHMDTLMGRNRQLNEEISLLVAAFNNEDSQMRQHGSHLLMEHQHRTIRNIALFGFAAFLLAVLFFWMLHRDLNKRHRNQVLLEQSNQHNEELLALRQNMMLTVSHDLRSPLTSIKGYAELIGETTQNYKCKEYEEAIMQSSERMLMLLNTLLSYYRLDTGKEEVEMMPFRVKDILKSLLIEYEPIAEMKDVEIDSAFTGDDTVVMGDRKRILQIAGNILSNAVKFTNNGRVSVNVGYADNTLTIKVQDTGTGMSEEQIKRIFAPFNRLENADTQEGFGLGLSIAKALTDLLGGRIDVESHTGFGSIFTVSIPIIEGDAEILQLTEKHTTVLPEGLRIAVVDDDVTVLRMTVEMLNKKNVQAVGCMTVDELFDRMRKSDFDLIITDIKLGGISGFDLLELLRDSNIGNSKKVPILAMTGRTERKAEDFINAGFSGCILKPFSYAELTQAIVNSIREYSQSDDDLFKAPKADFTTLLQGEEDVNGMLTLLIEQTETEVIELKSAMETGNMDAISFLQHKLESRWELLGIVKPMLRLRDALQGKADLSKAIDEVVQTAEQLIRQARAKMEGGAA